MDLNKNWSKYLGLLQLDKLISFSGDGFMGIDYGGGQRGQVPPEFGAGTLIQIVSPDFVI